MKERWIASAVGAGFTAAQAEWLWTAIPCHPLVEEWKQGSDMLPAAGTLPMTVDRFHELTACRP